MDETPPTHEPVGPRGARPHKARPARPGVVPGPRPDRALAPTSCRSKPPREDSTAPTKPSLRHVELGTLPVGRTNHVILAAERHGPHTGTLIEGLIWSDFLATLVEPESGLLVQLVMQDRVTELGEGLYRCAIDPVSRAGRYHLLVTDAREPTRFHPIFGRFDARLVAGEAFVGIEPEITASVVFVSSANLIKARVGVRMGGRRVPFDEVRLALYDERSARPIRLQPIAVDQDGLGFAELEAHGGVAQGLRIYACIVAVRIAGEMFESTRLFPVVRTSM